jgi:N-methylhydantoinase A
MRYRGQGHEIAVSFPVREANPATLKAAFDATYTALFGRIIPRLEIEAITWTLALAQAHEQPKPASRPPGTGIATTSNTRRIVESETGEAVEARVHRREHLALGVTIPGPAVIVEDGTTTIIPAGHAARIGADREIIIEGSVP